MDLFKIATNAETYTTYKNIDPYLAYYCSIIKRHLYLYLYLAAPLDGIVEQSELDIDDICATPLDGTDAVLLPWCDPTALPQRVDNRCCFRRPTARPFHSGLLIVPVAVGGFLLR